MKCAKCGKEFGDGVNCQYCGVDRVTGLGNYSGYDKPSGSSENLGNYSTHYASPSDGASNSTICYACGEVIPANSEYCPYCSKQLFVTCPKCGHTYSSQFPACNKCGTNRRDYFLRLEAKKQEERRREKEKEKRIEEESRLRNEASKLSNKLDNGYSLMIWWMMWLVLFILGPSLLNEIKDGTILVLIIGGGLCVAIAGQYIIIEISKQKIKRWKQEHPKDPRSKYL